MRDVAALTDAVTNKGIAMNRDRRRMLALGVSALAGPVFIGRAAADGSALVGWIERSEKAAAYQVRRVTPNGQRSGAAMVTRSEPGTCSIWACSSGGSS